MSENEKSLQNLLEETSSQQKELLSRFSEIHEALVAIEHRQDEHSKRLAMHLSRMMTIEAYLIFKEISYHEKRPERIRMIAKRQDLLRNAIGDMAAASYEDLLSVIQEDEVHERFIRDILGVLKEEFKTGPVN